MEKIKVSLIKHIRYWNIWRKNILIVLLIVCQFCLDLKNLICL